jgi:hypothetical protein
MTPSKVRVAYIGVEAIVGKLQKARGNAGSGNLGM